MTTYPQQLQNAISDNVIPPFWLGYFREAYREAINGQLLELYNTASKDGVTKKEIAEKMGRRPEQITRWLASPSNLESDTISDLALALGYVPTFGLKKIAPNHHSQQRHPLTLRINTPGYLQVDPPSMTSASALA